MKRSGKQNVHEVFERVVALVVEDLTLLHKDLNDTRALIELPQDRRLLLHDRLVMPIVCTLKFSDECRLKEIHRRLHVAKDGHALRK